MSRRAACLDAGALGVQLLVVPDWQRPPHRGCVALVDRALRSTEKVKLEQNNKSVFTNNTLQTRPSMAGWTPSSNVDAVLLL